MTSSTYHALVAGFVGLVVGGIVADFVTNVVGLFVLVTGFTTAAYRYFAIYGRLDEAQVERLTAHGFVLGMLLSTAIIAADLIVS